MHFRKPMLGVPLDWSNPLNKGIALHLAMNEGHGDRLQDLSLNGNHGTLTNMAFPSTAASGWNPGYMGVGLNFDSATDDYADCGNNPLLNPTNGHTVSALIYIDSIVTDRGIVAKWLATADGWMLKVESTGNVLKLGVKHGGNYFVAESASSLPQKAWTWVTGVFDGGDLRVYINGAQDGTPTACGGINPTNAPALVGCTFPTSEHFKGGVDQVRIHNRTLTAKEVMDYYINPWQVYLDE